MLEPQEQQPLQLSGQRETAGGAPGMPSQRFCFFRSGGSTCARRRADFRLSQVSVQLNGTPGKVGLHSSLKHPFKSKIPKLLEVGCRFRWARLRASG